MARFGEVGFAFCHLLGFQLLPRLKNLKKQRLYRPHKGEPNQYANLQPLLTRPIWPLQDSATGVPGPPFKTEGRHSRIAACILPTGTKMGK